MQREFEFKNVDLTGLYVFRNVFKVICDFVLIIFVFIRILFGLFGKKSCY